MSYFCIDRNLIAGEPFGNSCDGLSSDLNQETWEECLSPIQAKQEKNSA
jgi:hypothetical protein